MDPIDLKVAAWKARADQLRSGLRDVLVELGANNVTDLIKICAVGDVTVLDEKLGGMVAWLALVAIVDMFDAPPPDEGEGEEGGKPGKGR